MVVAGWSDDTAWVRINKKTLKLDSEASGQYLELATKVQGVQKGASYGTLNPESGYTEAERLFLGTVKDIEEKLKVGDRYTVIRAAGLLRQILLDQHRLLDGANRNHKLKLTFQIMPRGNPPVSKGLRYHWVNPDASAFPGAKTSTVDAAGLTRTEILYSRGESATVKDLIKVCANAKGGVHLGRAKPGGQQAIIDWDAAARSDMSLRSIAGLCKVVLDGAEPLVRAIVEAD